MEQGIKIRLYPNKEQESKINKLLGCYRVVYNQCLDYSVKMYKSEKQSSTLKNLGHFFHNELTKDENFIWLQEQNTKVLKQAIRDLLSAYSMFFKKVNGFPTYKTKKSNHHSCRFPSDAISKMNDYSTRRLSLANIHDIKFRCSDKYLDYIVSNKDNIRSATLSKNCAGHYFLSILIDGNLRKELPYTDTKIGIDLGVKDFVVTSDGEVFDNPHIKKSRSKRIKRLHRRISKKQKGSKNRNKARIKLAKEYEKIDNIKKNYLHLVSNSLLNDNQVIVMEDLNVKGMMKNHKLAESIQEMSFGELRRMLSYKSAWYGRQLEIVDRWYPSSKTCNKCGYIYKNLTLSEREWTCPVCGEHHDRDLNAARNILDEGMRIIGCRTAELKSVETPPLLSEQSRKQAELMKQKVYDEQKCSELNIRYKPVSFDEILSYFDVLEDRSFTSQLVKFRERLGIKDWGTGNCYWAATLIKNRFGGELYYDVVVGHFVVGFDDGKFYDFGGEYVPEETKNMVAWDRFEEYDPLQYERIKRDSIMNW